MITKFVSILIFIIFLGFPLATLGMSTFFKTWPPSVVAAIVLIVVLLNGFVSVPTVRGGLVIRFLKRTGRALKEGLDWILPIIDDVQLFSLELVTTKISVEIFTADQQEATLEGSFQWKPDIDKLMIFIEMSETTIKEGIADAIRSELTGVGSISELNDIIQRKSSLELLIDCTLRLIRPPHHHVNILKGVDPNTKKEIERIEIGGTFQEWFDEGCKVANIDEAKKNKFWEKIKPDQWRSPSKEIQGALKLDLVRFYEENVSRIRIVQEFGELFLDEESPVEKRHGIIVKKYQLTNYNFSDETEKSIQRERQAKGVVGGAEVFKAFVKETVKALEEEKVSPEDAITNAELLLGLPGVQKTRISGGGFPLVNITSSPKGGGK